VRPRPLTLVTAQVPATSTRNSATPPSGVSNSRSRIDRLACHRGTLRRNLSSPDGPGTGRNLASKEHRGENRRDSAEGQDGGPAASGHGDMAVRPPFGRRIGPISAKANGCPFEAAGDRRSRSRDVPSAGDPTRWRLIERGHCASGDLAACAITGTLTGRPSQPGSVQSLLIPAVRRQRSTETTVWTLLVWNGRGMEDFPSFVSWLPSVRLDRPRSRTTLVP
jgi:hypothetical protein